jgi:hypothetical protein
VKIAPSERAGVTGKKPFKSGWSSFFGHFVRVFEQHFDLSFCEALKCKYTVGGILESRFCLVRLMKCINLFSECY